MNLQETANCLAELGHETRLTIFRHLVKMGKTGVSVGEIQKELNIPASTLSHHISRLVRVELVKQVRYGRTLVCVSQYEKLQGILDFLLEECCEGETCIEVSCCE